tara:strand:+ start:46 stop:3462 length:3417 start_codon:yes stop_codon:yes gene_type:complete
MNLSDKIFGSNVDSDIQDIFKELQEGSFEVNPNEGIKTSPHTHYLGDRAPFARMWTAVNVRDAQHKDDKGKNTVYIINDNRENSYDETTIHSSVLKHQLTNNQYLKPTAGITGINSKSEGAVGALRRTTVDFVVHNKVDFDNIFLPFFLRPGTMVFVDFGWSDDALSLYNPVDKINNNDLKLSNLYSDIYDSKDGILAKQKGLMSTLCGAVTKYDVTVDELGSFKCNLEFVSQNYMLLDKEISDDNNLKFLFTNVMDELLVGYVAKALGEGNYNKGLNSDFDLDVLKKIDSESTNTFSKDFFDTNITQQAGIIDDDSRKIGVFYQNLTGDGGSYLDEKESLYMSFALFEDKFLNNFISYWVETTESGDDNIGDAKPDNIYSLKYTSQDSWVRYDKNLVDMQEETIRSVDEIPSFLYPNTWNNEETSNKKKPKLWKTEKEAGNTADDIKKHRMPLRELFINVPLISQAFKESKNINDALVFIFDKILKDSGNIINIKMISHNDSQVALTFQDVNLTGHIIPKEPLLTFDVTSGNSVVLNSDLKFETPKAGLSSMIAIKSMNEVNVFDNLDDMKLSFLNVVESEASKGERKMIIKSLPDIGFKSQKSKKININLENLFNSIKTINVAKGEKRVSNKYTDNVIGEEVSLRYNNFIKNQRETLGEILEEEKKSGINVTGLEYKDLPEKTKDGKTIKYAHSERNQKLLMAILDNFIESGNNSIAPILPVTLSLTIYGNNFLTIGDYITVNFLPSNYTNRVFFQIIGVDHTIDTSIWKTTYSTVMRIIPEQKVFQTGNIKNNLDNRVAIQLHPIFVEMKEKEVQDNSGIPNPITLKTVDPSKVADTTVTFNTLANYKHQFGDKDISNFKELIGKLDLPDPMTFLITRKVYNTNVILEGTEAKQWKNIYKTSSTGLISSVQHTGHLAWVLAVSDFILGDDNLDWSKYKDNDHEDFNMIFSAIGVNESFDINKIGKDTMYVNPIKELYTGKYRGDFVENILDGFDDPTDASPFGLDDLQESIGQYVANRTLFSNISYINGRIKANTSNTDRYDDKLSPILQQVIWGVGKSEEGETFINITEKFKNISDCLIIPNVLVPKRLLKFSQEEVTRNLFKSYINHKINLQSLIAAAIDPDYITPPTFSNLR